MVDKSDLVRWGRKYDRDHGWYVQKERELCARFHKTKVLTREDLAQVVEWKFRNQENKKAQVLEAVARNDDAVLARIGGQVFNVEGAEDAFRVNSLTMLNGVSPVLASVVLAFFDPKCYGVFDVGVWRALLGNEPPGLFTTQNYLRFLTALRKTAAKHNLGVRVVEKALFEKGHTE